MHDFVVFAESFSDVQMFSNLAQTSCIQSSVTTKKNRIFLNFSGILNDFTVHARAQIEAGSKMRWTHFDSVLTCWEAFYDEQQAGSGMDA